MAKPDFTPFIGGCGGVYFLAEPGELVVEVAKRDRNAGATTCELQALLLGPDREVLDRALIPDDGQPVKSGLGPVQTARLRATVQRPGIYALNVTVSQDRYGYNMVWGFRTSCRRYLIETARGHKDERHQEPIVLESPGEAGVVCFQPRSAELNIDLEGLPVQAGPVTLTDATGALLATLEPDAAGKASWKAPAGQAREASPWRLQFPSAKAVLNVDGLTRWNTGDPVENICLWSPDPASWFPFSENRWLVTPYQRHVYLQPGEAREVALRVHNNAARERRFAVSLEFPGAQWPAQLSASEVTAGAKASVPLAVACPLPEGDGPHPCHVRVTPLDTPGLSTYATVTVHRGEAPASRLLAMPLELQPYRHENEQFGYLPDYSLGNEFYFGAQNRPFVRAGRGLITWQDSRWTELDVNASVTSRPAAFEGKTFGLPSTKVAFDAEGWVYLTANCAGKTALLYSSNGGRTFAAAEVPGANGTIDIDQFSGHNLTTEPPAFVRFRRTSRDEDPRLRWRSVNDIELFLPRKVDGRIDVGEPILVSQACIGLSAHSGIPSSVVSYGSKVHVTWGEATDPAVSVPGVPQYVVTCDRETRALGTPALIGYGPPANDVHNSPSITVDGEGYLHVLLGTHGRPFQYARSLAPNDAGAGWTEPVSAGEGLSQTYIGFVCGPDGTLHAVFRLWQSGEPYPNSSHATLAYQRKRPGQPWEAPRILVRAPFSEYSVFYHRLTIDRAGRLFLSYDYWSTHWFYRNDHFGSRRAMIMSPDGGESWKLVQTADLAGSLE